MFSLTVLEQDFEKYVSWETVFPVSFSLGRQLRGRRMRRIKKASGNRLEWTEVSRYFH